MKTYAGVLGFVCVWSGVAFAQTQVKPRFLVLFDTSGSMNHTPQMATLGLHVVSCSPPPGSFCYFPCGTDADCPTGDVCRPDGCHFVDGLPTHGDGSVEQPGCDENGDGLYNDSKIFQAKGALLNVISAFGQVDYGLETYFQTEQGQPCTNNGQCTSPFTCNGGRCTICGNACGADWITECGSTFSCNTNCATSLDSCDTWDVPNSCNGHTNALGANVTCSTGNGPDGNQCLEYLGVSGNGTTCTPNSGIVRVPFATAADNFPQLVSWMNNTFADGHELRAQGFTPIAGSLGTAKQYLQNQIGTQPLLDDFVPCRQYAVILLTDGMETCGTLSDDIAAAQALRSTTIHRTNGTTATVDVKTYVIAFALCPSSNPNCSAKQTVDQIAAAGGTGQAFSAFSGSDIELALAQIIQGSILVEHCNGVDDNCNGIIDEGYDKGAVCQVGVGACQRTGMKICGCNPGDASCDPTLGQVGRGPLGTICSATPGTPSTEVCNGIDDNCDGIVDNVPGGCPSCTPIPETCNGLDDDCDGIVDNPDKIFPCPSGTGSCPPPCGLNVGVCTPGTLACVGGQLTCQGGTGPSAEVCDGKDNDCDGVIDGISRACYPSGTPGCNVATGQCMGICLLGTQICPRLSQPASSNSFGACMGAVTPQTEICNGLDDDCNGIVDDNPLGEGDMCWTLPPPAMPGVGPCRPGHKHCVNGSFQCQGQIGPMPEICDGIDNDCDGMIDNGATCPPMYACLSGACQPECAAGEFACAPDRVCVDPTTMQPCTGSNRAGCYCLPNPCVTMPCPAGQRCEPTAGGRTCVDPCAGVTCPPNQTCVDGSCRDCYSMGCPSGERCIGGACLPDPCAGVQCPFQDYCRNGQCVPSCLGVSCPSGQTCTDGQCHPDLCASANCGVGQVCNPASGMCVPNPCSVSCMPGQACNPSTGQCEPDPCGTIRCGACQQCVVRFDGSATCDVFPQCQPGPTQAVTQTGGGGCTCEVSHDAQPPWWTLLLGLAALVRRRRSR